MSKSSPPFTANASSPINVNNSAAAVTASGVGHSANAVSDAAKNIGAPMISSLSDTQTYLGTSEGRVLTPVASVPIKKSVKMRPGSSNTAR